MIEVGWQERQHAWSPIPTHALINRQWLPTASFHRTHSWVSYSVFFCPIFLASPWRVLPNSPLPLATRNLRVLFPQLWQALSSFPSRAISIYPSGASSENSWLNGPLLFVPYRIFTSHWKYLSKSSDAQHHQLNAIGDPGTQYIHITFLDRLVTKSFPALCCSMDCSPPGSSLSMGFSRQEYWYGLPYPSPGVLPVPGIKHQSPALQADSLLSEPPGKPHIALNTLNNNPRVMII